MEPNHLLAEPLSAQQRHNENTGRRKAGEAQDISAAHQSPVFLKGSADLHRKLWPIEQHPIPGCSLHPTAPSTCCQKFWLSQRGEPGSSRSEAVTCVCVRDGSQQLVLFVFSRGPCAAPATSGTSVRCVPGSRGGGARGTGSARTAARAAGSAGVWRASMAPPVRCARGEDTAPTAKQVTPTASWALHCSQGQKMARKALGRGDGRAPRC